MVFMRDRLIDRLTERQASLNRTSLRGSNKILDTSGEGGIDKTLSLNYLPLVKGYCVSFILA